MFLPRKTGLIACLYLCWLTFPGYSNNTDPLSQAIYQRLALMQDVAAYKWLHKLPIENLQRETLVLNATAQGALRYGIELQSSRQFFLAQIIAAKEIQEYWFAKWATGNAPRSAPDLISDIRPRLIQLGDEILLQLRTDHTLGQWKVQGLSHGSKMAIVDALEDISRYPDRLTQIQATGQIRIGTTGDYAPFSNRIDHVDTNTGPAYSGIDIQMAHNLAHYLKVEATFVPTTWPTLMEDLEAGLFDIAMSGVSRTTQRATVAFFSNAYWTGGKTPIVRCSDIDKFDALEKIDQPGVRVIVNPGGTNERFVKSNLHKASVEIFDDNRSIFSRIILGEADLMITDRIEVLHQSNLHSELCASMKNNLTYQEKAYLLPQENNLRTLVNAWLELRISEGVVSNLFNEALH